MQIHLPHRKHTYYDRLHLYYDLPLTSVPPNPDSIFELFYLPSVVHPDCSAACTVLFSDCSICYLHCFLISL